MYSRIALTSHTQAIHHSEHAHDRDGDGGPCAYETRKCYCCCGGRCRLAELSTQLVHAKISFIHTKPTESH